MARLGVRNTLLSFTVLSLLVGFLFVNASRTFANSATYYVSPTGSDGNPGTETSPFRTLTKGVSVLQPGATLLVFPGTYAESLDANIPSGTDWTAPVTLRAYDPANRPVIRPPVSSSTEYRVLFFTKNKFTGLPQHHIVVDGFVLDGSNTNPDAVKITDGAHHIRLMNSEVKNAPRQGILTTNVNSAYNEFINLDVHNNGTDTLLDHGLYISTPYNLVAHCHVYNNAAYGIHIYNGDGVSAHDNIVRDNLVHDQAVKSGIVIASGSGNLVYNNVVWGNKYSGIHIDFGANGTTIYNNTIYGNGSYGIDIGSSGSNTAIRNNIIYKNGSAAIDNGGSGTTTGTNLINVDPKFNDEEHKDFRLKTGSPALDRGSTVPDVQDDLDGNPRPQGVAYDIGAYESAILVNDGFESGAFAQWTRVSGLAIQQQQVYTGAYAARGTSTGTATYVTKQLAVSQPEVYYRIRFKLLSATTTSPYLLKVRTATGDMIAGLYLNSDSNLGLSNNVTKVTTTSTTAVTVGTWHELQMRLLINGSTGQSEVWLDGTRIDGLSMSGNFGDTSIGQIMLGENATGKIYDIAFDDITVATTFVDS